MLLIRVIMISLETNSPLDIEDFDFDDAQTLHLLPNDFDVFLERLSHRHASAALSITEHQNSN
jgi:hypothetical protein